MIRSLIQYIVIILLLFNSCTETERGDSFYNEDLTSIAEYISENLSEFSIFFDLMTRTELKDPLNSYNPNGNGYTLFLPTNGAFYDFIENNSNYSSIEELLEDQSFLYVLGRYHLVNSQYNTNEFPYGALPDTTATGDFLTIGFSSGLDSTVYKVNNISAVVDANLEMENGIIHVIEKVLKPVNSTGYEWLKEDEGFSILTEILEITGVIDTMGLFRQTPGGIVIRNKYTVFAEHDSIYNRNGIYSANDLIDKYGNSDIPLTDPANPIYQFASYHILEGSFFLVDFDETRNYNTYANAPIHISSGLEIMINRGVDTFQIVVDEYLDTSYVTHLSLYYQESNILTKNGAIHFLSEVMEYYTPAISQRTFQFMEEPELIALMNSPGSYFFDDNDQDLFEVLSWVRSDFLLYYKSSSSLEPAFGGDYISLKGNFKIEYTIPKILPGKYAMYIRAHAYNRNNEHATINVYLDGKKMGASFDLNVSGESASDPFRVNNAWEGFNVGQVELTKYMSHVVTIETLIPGIMIWDLVRFIPDN
jgi:uncharacterized surface protein with fasciclin (FAS1) repeats